jgi:hypothetical protein
MMNDDRGGRLLRLHLEFFRQENANAIGLQQLK